MEFEAYRNTQAVRENDIVRAREMEFGRDVAGAKHELEKALRDRDELSFKLDRIQGANKVDHRSFLDVDLEARRTIQEL